MYSVALQKEIHQVINLFHILGTWHSGEEATIRETTIKLFFTFYHLLFPLSLLLGGIKSDDKYESMFLVEASNLIVQLC